MKNGIYNIPVTFEMYGVVKVEATNLEEAKQKALEEEPLPLEKYYVDNSIEINEEFLEHLLNEESLKIKEVLRA